ncbi:sugar ABC transporter ATP-binding protein [Streptomyces sp. NPDC001852]|uniref:sugar ABC transporter ATP-binding protein n=1 Tax=unclassified Streptomyces TaxID=2593676 RepID=UPI003321601B
MSGAPPALLRMRGISKEFPGVRALSDVELTVHPGEVVALLGENGAGKSTLMNILAGVHADYEGTIEIDGEPVRIHSPKHAQQHGIAMIHQELNLVPELSVSDNVFLGRELRTARGTLDRTAMHARTAELLADLGLTVPPGRLVRDCRIAEQQLVEVAKALNGTLRILVLDEPTSALAEAEVERLFSVIRRLAARGVGLIYISHRLEELEEIADSATVLRDGTFAGRRPVAGTDRAELVRLMVGRPLGELFPRAAEQRSDGPVRLRVKGLTTTLAPGGTRTPLHSVHFEVRAGEILGVAGLMGAGRSEVLEALFGAGDRVHGEITLNDRPYTPHTPRTAIRRGIALVAEDRKAQSLVIGNTVRFNTTLAALDRYLRPWRTVDARREKAAAAGKVAELRTKTHSLDAVVGTLSGGNQQKVVLAKCLLTEPSVLLLDEPTRGIDVGAKAEIHALMDALAGQGTAIIAVSSELPELIGMCDRIVVLCEGRLTGEFHRDPARGPAATQEAILTAAMARQNVVAGPPADGNEAEK